MDIVNFDGVKRELEKRISATLATRGRAASLEFTAKYAIYVHENMAMPHRIGQAKYLEQPMREHRQTLAKIVDNAMTKEKLHITEAMIRALQFLKVEAQKLVPVDTGYLRDSATIRVVNI